MCFTLKSTVNKNKLEGQRLKVQGIQGDTSAEGLAGRGSVNRRKDDKKWYYLLEFISPRHIFSR